MKCKSFLFSVTIFISSFAVAQSQMIYGTIVPVKKKSVVLLPGNKKDTIPSAQKKADAVPNLKNPVNSSPVLQGSDTTLSVTDKNTTTIDPQLLNKKQQSNLNGQFISGTQDSLKNDLSTPAIAGMKINSPLDVLDTTLINASGGDAISKYSLPPQKSTLRPQMITGTLIAKEGAAVSVVPVSDDSLMKQNMVNMIVPDNPLFPPERDSTKVSAVADSATVTNATTGSKSVLDGLDTTNMVYDPSTHISSTTLALRPSEYKHQMLPTGLLIGQTGAPVIIEPISKDSLETLNRKLNDTTAMQSSDANSSNDSFNSTSFPDSSNVTNFKTNFFVKQNGIFSIRFTTEKFYLNISQAGKVIDFEILSNGKITSNESSKIVQVGNIKVNYNVDGTIASIADTRVAYTFDGKVNRVGNINISYSNAGFVEKVADFPIFYNSNKAVEKIADFRVGYDSKQMVIGIDDSNGLVVFKPEVK